MNQIEFVEGVRKEIIDSNLDIYKNLFAKTSMGKATDPYWIKALGFFNSLTDDKKQVFFDILRQIEVDTVSNVFAILDGVSVLELKSKGFKLISNENGNVISGSLQDVFLELENG